MSEALPISDARATLTDLIGRAQYAGEITYIRRGRGKEVAAIVPAELARKMEALEDAADAALADQLYEEYRAGQTRPVDAAELFARMDAEDS